MLTTACGRITRPPQWPAGHKTWRRQGEDMSLQDDEKRALDAIENQLRTEDPQLMDYFSALGGMAPPLKPVKGWERAAPYGKAARRGRHRRTDRPAYVIVIELLLVIIAVVFVVMLILGAVWMLAALSH